MTTAEQRLIDIVNRASAEHGMDDYSRGVTSALTLAAFKTGWRLAIQELGDAGTYPGGARDLDRSA